MADSLPKVCVCVIGAGIAGLGAAQRLVEAGVKNIMLLEAGDRIGGRVHTVKHDNSQIELGAHWIHGEEDNVVFEWASENGLVSEGINLIQTGLGNTIYVRNNGEIVPQDLVDEFSEIYQNLEQSSKKDFTDYPGSLGQYFTEKFMSVNKWGSIGNELLDWEGRFQNCINGSDNWFEVSAKGLLQYKECNGNPVVNWTKGGYKNLVDHLKKNIPPSRIRLESPVNHIFWGKGVVPSGPGCRITLVSGAVIQAEHIIFTPSIGVLKDHGRKMFTPTLPTKKLQAIEGLDISVVNKIYIKFPHRWWNEDCDGFSFLHNSQEKPDCITKQNWEVTLLGFYSVYQHPTMMCGWITGTGALMMESVSEEEVSHRCVLYLRKMLPSSYDIPDPVFCKRTTWGSYPWSKGSYSFHSMKTKALGVTPADLAEPLYDNENTTPLVCFAGEATHDCYYSTVHGALETGRREADRLIKHFNGVGTSSSVGEPAKDRERYTVAIVGAGAAGIGAARELTAQGITSVLILEASNRIGGRIHTVESCSGVVDLGAQWIHGESENLIYQFAKSRNLLHSHVSVDGKGNFFTNDGEEIDNALVEEVMEIINEADECCKKSTSSSSLTVGHVFRKIFFGYLETCKNDTPETRKTKEALFYWALRWYRIDNACDSLHQLSATCWESYKLCQGENNMNPKNGFLSIVNALLTETKAVVKFNAEVECINYASEVTTNQISILRHDGETFPVIIRCKDGKEYEAQHVMVTPAIGYLKKNLSLFSPPLPKKLQQTILSKGFGTLDKIFLEYDDVWWWKGCEGIQLVWTKDIPDFEFTTRPATFTQKEEHQTSDWWVKAISGFDPVFNHKAMLCGWIGGHEAEHMETLSEEEVGRACTRLLRCFLGRKDIPLPKKVYRSQWATNRLFEGSYCHHSVGCKCWSEDMYKSELNTPVLAADSNGNKIPVLVFAGEANSINYYSTVHGAFQNGISQAAHFIDAQKSYGVNRKIMSKI